MFDTAKTVTLCLVGATIPAFFLREDPLSRLFLLYLWPLQVGFLILFRFCIRTSLRILHLRGYDYRQVVIVGCNTRAAIIAKRIIEMPDYGIKLLGIIDDQDSNNEKNNNLFKHRIIGKLSDIEEILRSNVVDEVFVTLPIKSFYSEMENIIYLCEQAGVEVKIPTDIFKSKIAKYSIANFGEVEFLDFYTGPKMTWQMIVKRTTDVIVSSMALVLFAPLFVVVMLAIKFTSSGPVFFIQKRIGYNGRLFNCLKFRTMIDNADKLKKELDYLNEMDGPVFKIDNDPRVTNVGRFLRKTSIDELPQLINVFKGDMSLVGPRPPVPEEVCQYKLADRRRLSIRPGITCIWQVSGRNNIGFDKWMDMDMQYIDKWSLWLDFKILLKTIPAVILQKGAH
jgi:exopolysaccharide biosynthesis polyprenyl glycosylphosphotransferase